MPFFAVFIILPTQKSEAPFLLNKVNIELENVVAFGDDVNDIEMLNECGFGIAVANAVSGVKQIANEITDSNNEDGVAKYIEKYIL